MSFTLEKVLPLLLVGAMLHSVSGQSMVGTSSVLVPIIMGGGGGSGPPGGSSSHYEQSSEQQDLTGAIGLRQQPTIYDIVPMNYTIHESPPLIADGPVPVQFSVSVRNIPNLDELAQDLTMEMNLRIYWIDTRLNLEPFFEKYPNKSYMSANPAMLSQIWVPDVYSDYTKSVSVPRIMSPPASLRIYPNGTVRYSGRITMQFACPMDFRFYPADTQFCNMSLESYAYTRDNIFFSWRREGRAKNFKHRLAHFDFDLAFNGDDEDTNFVSGSYPAIKLTIRLSRRISYHLLQTYIPSFLFVVVSWLSFLVPVEGAQDRMAICMTTLLTLTAMFAAVRQSTPSVSYVKALDVWMVACIFFVFLTLVEYTLVLRLLKNVVSSEQKESKCPSTKSNLDVTSTISSPSDLDTHNNGLSATSRTEKTNSYQTFPQQQRGHCGLCGCFEHSSRECIWLLELGSFAFIATAFVFFNFLYWPWLLTNASHASTTFK